MSANWFISSNSANDLLIELLDLEENWQSKISKPNILDTLEELVNHLEHYCVEKVPNQEELYKVIDSIFDELAFSGPGLQSVPESALGSVSYCIESRTGNSLTLAIVMAYLLKELGFNAFIAELQDDIGLVVKLSNSELIVIDSVSGATEYIITSDDLNESMLSGIAAYAQPIDQEELIKELLSEQKICLLAEGFYEEALLCVETLMALLPEDPYERRDRGIVLQQLDCDHVASDDLKYFIKACPNDPMAAFFKSQLEEQVAPTHTLH
ncbi:invasion regulator SirB1 [Psychrosphaera haliotis]|uniref:tetratricopeptide repeat protein n=1 Tax=Psychrosphaera haliotis TaxID=555083 RepID=UPI0031CF8772